MKEYKRLTERVRNAISVKATSTNDNRSIWNAIERLAELEDKIENGTLIELGYHIRKSYRNHDDQRYKIILIDEVKIDEIGYDGLTKAEAEEKIKELGKL